MPRWSSIHYNAIAKEIRELFPVNTYADMPDHATLVMSRKAREVERTILSTLALKLAERFEDDNERFDPLRFLDACSPDTTLYPLSDLWEDHGK